jgi:hypothetical protein
MATTARRGARTGTRLVTRGTGLIGLEPLAQAAGVHPELVRRLIRLGLIEPRGGTGAAPTFRRSDAPLVARAVRLRRDLGLNYAGAVLACELLARIDELERQLKKGPHEVIAWTRTV